MQPDSEDLSIFSEPGAMADEIGAVREGLYRFNFAVTGLTEHQNIALFVRDRARTIQGGLLGTVWGGWLHITDLWLAEECRGRGLGRQLLAKASAKRCRAEPVGRSSARSTSRRRTSTVVSATKCMRRSQATRRGTPTTTCERYSEVRQ